MRKLIAWLLLLTLCLSLFAGCKKQKPQETDPTTAPTTPVTDDSNQSNNSGAAKSELKAALEYIKTVYRKPSEKTPKDFQRIGNVPVNGKNYEVVWTVNVSEDIIKIVKGDNGMVTIDVKEDVEAEVKYVLTATISDDKGNKVSHSWNHLIPLAGNMVDIVNDAYALESGASMDYEVTLTGKVVSIDTPWDAGYKNITVTIVVAGAEGKPIQCYRLSGDGADKLKPNDTITVTGTLKNYNGTIEFDAGCTLDKLVVGEEVKAPSDPKQILKDAYALAEGGALAYKSTLTGVVTKINTEYNMQYKNVTVTMVVGGDTAKAIQCYRLTGDKADQIGVGDTITVTGWIVNYKGTVQFNAGCTLDKFQDTGKNEPKPEDTFTTTLVPEVVTAPKAGVAYKFFMYQKSFEKNFYLTGEMDGFYYQTTYDPAKAVDVFVEEVSGGYRLYFMKGNVKNYLEVQRAMGTDGKLHNNVVFTTTPTAVAKWNATLKTFTYELDVDGTKTAFYLGTYSFYKTFSASDAARVTGENADKMDTENFVGRLATMKETKVSEAEKAYEQLKTDYPPADGAQNTAENFTRKSVYDVDGKKVNVVWTVSNNAVVVVNNNDGTVTIQVTRGEEAINYTLTATITDGDKTLTSSWECVVPAVPATSPKDIVDAAYALQPGESLADAVTLTGIVASIDSAYSEQYGNITVTIFVEDMLDKPIQCYRLKGEGAANIAFGDNITVTGILKNYNGTIEFDAGCTLDARMSMVDIVDAAYALESGKTLDRGYALVGVVTSVDTPYNEQYGNVTVTIAVLGCDDKPIQCYRLKGEGAAELTAGYMVAVYGTLKNYNGTFEFDAGCSLFDYAAPEIDEPPVDDQLYITKPVEAPQAEVAYKFAMNQAVLGTTLYFNGGMNGYYLGTTENLDEAVDVYLETVEGVEGNYNFYFMDGEAKKYIVAYKSGTYNNVKIADEPGAAFTYSAEAGTYVVDLDGTICYLGTYGNKNDIRPSAISYITGDNAANVGVSQHVAYFAEMVPAGEALEGVTPPVEVGVGYKFYMNQAVLGTTLYFNGGMNGYYLGTTENLEEAVDVYLEAVEGVEGNYNFYFMDGEAKKYIVAYKSGTYNNVKIADEPGAAFTYSAEAGTYVVDLDGTLCYLGTYGNKNDIRPSAISYITGDNAANVGVSQHVAQFGSVVLKEVGLVSVEAPQAGVAYKYAMNQAVLGTTLYFNGGMNGYYLGTTENYDEAVDVYLEAVEGAEGNYNFYFMDGEAKKYIVAYKSGTYNNVKIADEPGAAFTYSAEAGTYVVDLDGTICYLGTYGNKNDIRPSAISYITGDNAANVGVSQHVAYFAVMGFVS